MPTLGGNTPWLPSQNSLVQSPEMTNSSLLLVGNPSDVSFEVFSSFQLLRCYSLMFYFLSGLLIVLPIRDILRVGHAIIKSNQPKKGAVSLIRIGKKQAMKHLMSVLKKATIMIIITSNAHGCENVNPRWRPPIYWWQE